MNSGPIWIIYTELSGGASVEGSQALGLKDYISAEPHIHEEEIARYLESAPSYSGMGTIVGDVLNPQNPVVLFPGKRTDGVYIWQAELSYYVRKYHLRVPSGLVDRMESLNWQPPTEDQIQWQRLGMPDIQTGKEKGKRKGDSGGKEKGTA